MASQEHKEAPKIHSTTTNEDPLCMYGREGILKAQSLGPTHLNFSPSDTILCSYPKSGTTWLKALAFAISTRARFDLTRPDTHPLLSSNPHKLIPFLEFEIAQSNSPRNPELTPLVSTHMPYKMLPDPVLESGCKIVYICRNPKDVLVSDYHFSKKLPGGAQHGALSLESMFHLFCTGPLLLFGSYWDHVLGFWEASLDDPERVLFLKYEDMISQGSAHVRRLAEFMGCPFSDQEEREGVPEKIGEMCSFGSLSQLEVNKSHETGTKDVVNAVISVSNSSFFRKGEVGDWRNYLSEEMSKKLDHITLQKLGKYSPGLNVM